MFNIDFYRKDHMRIIEKKHLKSILDKIDFKQFISIEINQQEKNYHKEFIINKSFLKDNFYDLRVKTKIGAADHFISNSKALHKDEIIKKIIGESV